MRWMMQGKGKEVELNDEISTEGGLQEVAQVPENILTRSTEVTETGKGTIDGGRTCKEVELWVDTRMNQNSEKQDDEIIAAVEDTFVD